MAIAFNGTDQAIKETGFLVADSDAFTIAVKFKGVVSSGDPAVAGAFNTSSSLNGALYLRRRDDLGGLVLQQYSVGDENTAPVSLADDVWHSAVIVSNGSGAADLYLDDDAVRSISFPTNGGILEDVILGVSIPFGTDSGEFGWFNGKVAYYRRSKTAISAANADAYNSATSVSEIDAVLPDGANLISDATVTGTASALTNVGTPTYDADDPLASATPTITDINTNNQYIPGAANTLNGSNLSTTGGSISINGVAQTITNHTATAITFTGVRGGNPYNQSLTLTYTDSAANSVTQTVQQVPAVGFAVTAASPNTTDDASLWTGLVDTATGNPVTVVDGDQALVADQNNLGNLAVTPSGEISADTTGNFTVQFWQLSEGVWGDDQTVAFEVPEPTEEPQSGAGTVANFKDYKSSGLRGSAPRRVRTTKGHNFRVPRRR